MFLWVLFFFYGPFASKTSVSMAVPFPLRGSSHVSKKSECQRLVSACSPPCTRYLKNGNLQRFLFASLLLFSMLPALLHFRCSCCRLALVRVVDSQRRGRTLLFPPSDFSHISNDDGGVFFFFVRFFCFLLPTARNDRRVYLNMSRHFTRY